MSRFRTSVAALAILACLSPMALAQDKVKPAVGEQTKVVRQEITNGTHTIVINNPSGPLGQGEEAALRNYEQADRWLAAVEQLQDLRGLYLRNEVALERRRGQVNPLLYGYSSEYGASSYAGGFGGGYPYSYPYGFGSFGYFSGGSSSSNVVNSIAQGIGNEGVVKNELAKALTDPSASVAYERALRNRDMAVARLPEKLRGDIGQAGPKSLKGRRLTLVMKKDAEKITGNEVSEDADWITVELDEDKGEVRVRKTDVDRIQYPKITGKPAANVKP
jgi:hypothetical protein